MSEEKRQLIRDVTTRINKLPEDKKHYILGYMNGVADTVESNSRKDVMEIKNTNKSLAEKIEADRPKTIFADAVSASHTSILIGDLAKLICQNGYQIGQKRLFQWMRDNGYLMVSGSSRNMPKQKYVEQGLFEIKESNVQNPDGSVRITRTTKVSGKGQLYFVNKFLGQEAEKADGD